MVKGEGLCDRSLISSTDILMSVEENNKKMIIRQLKFKKMDT